MSVGMSKATDSPIWPWSNRNRYRSLVSRALPKPANCRIVPALSRYMVRRTTRVLGKDPGSPRSRSTSIAEFSGPYQVARGRPPRVSGGMGGADRRSGEPDEPWGTPALSIVCVITSGLPGVPVENAFGQGVRVHPAQIAVELSPHCALMQARASAFPRWFGPDRLNPRSKTGEPPALQLPGGRDAVAVAVDRSNQIVDALARLRHRGENRWRPPGTRGAV